MAKKKPESEDISLIGRQVSDDHWAAVGDDDTPVGTVHIPTGSDKVFVKVNHPKHGLGWKIHDEATKDLQASQKVEEDE